MEHSFGEGSQFRLTYEDYDAPPATGPSGRLPSPDEREHTKKLLAQRKEKLQAAQVRPRAYLGCASSRCAPCSRSGSLHVEC